ncbi:DUF4869 domain-containing protein [Butyrivibrio sp. NC2002]|uniref:DUF4869 domain-containing protein n=1 Tax=Butyrivibrio sp. NC2002 TaxID=1410610 RepID=UPI00055F16AC|nr:DUF4869 domain-containing protein [Butyrivibrio sp. NC2002]
MLNIIYGELEKDNYIYDPDTFFNNQYFDDWLTTPLSKEMILDIDKSEVVGPNLIQSPVLGPIPPERLSGGVKTLILIDNDDEHIFNASACGNNCAKWLLKIAETKDITVRLGYLMDFGREPFAIHVVNTDKVVHNLEELDDEVIDNRLLR